MCYKNDLVVTFEHSKIGVCQQCLKSWGLKTYWTSEKLDKDY